MRGEGQNIHLRVSRWVTCSVMLVFLWFTWSLIDCSSHVRDSSILELCKEKVEVKVFQLCLLLTYILELAGEALVLFSELGDQKAFFLLRRPLARLRLLQQGSQTLMIHQNLTDILFLMKIETFKNCFRTLILHRNSGTL